jgi:hypothetical protein
MLSVVVVGVLAVLLVYSPLLEV